MKNIFKSKKRILAFFASISLVLASSITGLAIWLGLGINHIVETPIDDNAYYEFDGKTFKTKEELDEYIKENIRYTTKENAQDFYLYNSKPYAIDSMYQITKDIESKNPIIEEKTIKNVNDHIIDTANQLSGNVITNSNEKAITVYKGYDGMAYLNKNEAISTHEKIEKKYMVNDLMGNANTEFGNINEVISHYENVVKKQLEKGVISDKYNVSGIDMTKEQVMQWIGQTSNTVYNHNGFKWSPNNIPNSSQMQLTDKDKEKIQPFSPVKNAYWLNYNSNGLRGTFSGPQYIETNETSLNFVEKLRSNWNQVESKSINALLTPLMALSEFVKATANDLDHDGSKDWDIKDLFVNDKEKKYEQLKILFKKLTNEKIDSIQSGFKYLDIKRNLSSASDLPLFEKNLVFIKNLYLFLIIRNNIGKEQGALNLTNFLKETFKEQIKASSTIMNGNDNWATLDLLFQKETIGTMRSKSILNLSDLLDLFLNPSKFQYTSPSKLSNIDGLVKGLNTIGEVIFEDFGKINDLRKNVNQYKEDIKRLQDRIAWDGFNRKIFKDKEEKKRAEKEFKEALKDPIIDPKTGKINYKNVKPGGNTGTMSGVQKMIGRFNIAQQVWNMGNMLSFFSYKTYENDLGNGQILKYEVTGFKIPLFEIEFENDDFKKRISQINLIDSQILPTPEKENDKYYIVYGSLFTNRELAEQYLKDYIIANPLQFSDTNMLYINIMNKEEEFEVILDKESENPKPLETQYLEQFSKFKEKIFDRYFKSTATKLYSDGFGEFFNRPNEALISLHKKITNNNFNVKYKIEGQQNKINYYYDTFEEAQSAQKIFMNNKIESKTILNSSLIGSTYYDELKTLNKMHYSIFKIYFKKQNRYFATYNDALFYMVNNTHIKRQKDTTTYYEISFKGVLFKSEAAFYKWVSENTKIVKGESK